MTYKFNVFTGNLDEVGAGSSITGSDTQVLFFDGANNPAGDAGFTYNKTTDALTIAGSQVVPLISGSTVANGDIAINGTTSATKDTSVVYLQNDGGLVGIGASSAVSAWMPAVTSSVIEAVNTSLFFGKVGDINFNSNAYINTAGNWTYKTSSNAGNFALYNAGLILRVAGSGTAGNAISWTTTLDSNITSGTTITSPGGSIKALIANNSTSTGNIFEAQDNGTAVFSILDGGNIQLSVNSSTAGISNTWGGGAVRLPNSGGVTLYDGVVGANIVFNYGNAVSGGTAIARLSPLSQISTQELLLSGNISATPALTKIYLGQGGSGTNISGGDSYIVSGIGTGTGTPGSLFLQTSATGSSGATGQTVYTRMSIDGTGAVTVGNSNLGSTAKALVVNNGNSSGNIFEAQDNGTAVFTVLDGGNTSFNPTAANQAVRSKTVTLTEAGGAENVITITNATTQGFGLELSYKVYATDATDYAVREGSIKVACINVGGTVTGTLSGASEAADGSVIINTNAKTLTYAITLDVATANTAKVAFNIDSDMTVSAAHITWTAVLNGQGTIT